VKPEVRRLVKFFRFNLMDSLPFREEMDIIFCRNVMIYFEKETQAQLVEKFRYCLRPGGYLFIGHSESLCNHQHQFKYIKPTIYQK
jgi:chemotaxis protein methyltransferase CheR